MINHIFTHHYYLYFSCLFVLIVLCQKQIFSIAINGEDILDMALEKRAKNLNYDEVLEYIGQFGTFQKRIFFLLWLISAAGGLAVMVFAFTGM